MNTTKIDSEPSEASDGVTVSPLYETVSYGRLRYLECIEKQYRALHDFVKIIARLNYDGEELVNGETGETEEFLLENDDAVDTVNSLIHLARKLQ